MAALKAATPRLTVIEPTGSDFLPLLAWLVVSDVPVALVDAAWISAISPRPGIEGTDPQLLADFAAMHQTELRPINIEASEKTQLFQIVDYRDLRVSGQATARKWQRRAITEGVAKIVELAGQDLEQSEAQLREVDARIASLLGIQLP